MAIQSTNAQVFCNIGPIIDGNIADEYAQGSGLVRTRGSIRLDGVFSPSVGSDVDIGYARLGRTVRFPRSLQVLSVFADPFKRVTTVSIGCKITLVDDLRPPEKDPSSKEENGDVPCEVFKNGPILPISARYVAEQALAAMGISGSIPDLTNKFSIEEFDMSPGYTTVLSDLLVSENYVGFIGPNRTFKTKKLQDSMGSGALVEVDKVLEFSQVGFGELPGKAVIVKYSSLKLKPKEELDALLTEEERQKRDWEKEEVIGFKRDVFIRAIRADQTLWTGTYSYIPKTISLTTYDSWDRVISSTVTTESIFAETCGAWIGAAVEAFSQPGVSGSLDTSIGYDKTISQVITTFKYKIEAPPIVDDPLELAQDCVEEPKPDGYADVLSQSITETVPVSAIAGGSPVQFLCTKADGKLELLPPVAGGQPSLVISYPGVGLALYNMINSLTEITFEKDEESGITKTVTKKTIAYYQSPWAQQEMAWLSYKARGSSTDTFDEYDANGTILSVAGKLVDGGSETRIRTEREYGLQKRPTNAQRSNSAYSKPSPAEQISEIEWVSGNTSAQLQREFQLPYAPDDIINWTELEGYTSIPSDAPAKAAAYGEMQNKFFLGNRNGLSIKTTPETLPTEPLSPFYISGGGYTGSYLTNGMAWTFGPESIAVGTDGLYWGAAGTDGAPTGLWIPLPPGVTLPPIGTPIVDNAPVAANSIPTPIGFDPNAPGSIFTSLPTNSPGTFKEILVAPTVYPPYTKIVSVIFDISVGLEATFLPYNANGNTKDVEFITEFYLAQAQEYSLLASKRSFSLTRNDVGFTGTVANRGASLRALAITGTAAGNVRMPSGSVATLAITGTAAGNVRVAGITSATLAITGTAAGTNSTPAAYRYWRMTSLSLFNSANFLQLAEIEYATDNTGSIVSRPSDGASAATAYLSPDGGGVVANVNDNNTATDAAWGSSRWGDSLFHITIDMGSARTITHWRQRWTGAFGSGLSGLTIQASNTAGSGYVTIEVLSGLSNPGADTYSSWIQIQ
jgi:hypothetical protein